MKIRKSRCVLLGSRAVSVTGRLLSEFCAGDAGCGDRLARKNSIQRHGWKTVFERSRNDGLCERKVSGTQWQMEMYVLAEAIIDRMKARDESFVVLH